MPGTGCDADPASDSPGRRSFLGASARLGLGPKGVDDYARECLRAKGPLPGFSSGAGTDVRLLSRRSIGSPIDKQAAPGLAIPRTFSPGWSPSMIWIKFATAHPEVRRAGGPASDRRLRSETGHYRPHRSAHPAAQPASFAQTRFKMLALANISGLSSFWD